MINNRKSTLENRIARLEKLLKKNESANDPTASKVYAAANQIRQIVNDLCTALAYDDIVDHRAVNLALKSTMDDFSDKAYARLNSVFNDR